MEMKENIIGEQLEIETQEAEISVDEKSNSDFETSSEKNLSSPIGKFKNVESLFDAYNNLQSEFTRKSQKLSEILKSDNLDNSVIEQGERVIETKQSNSLDSTIQSNENERDIAENSTLSKPLYLSEDWKNSVELFLMDNPRAKQFAREITNEIASDKVVASMPNSLEIAYNKVLAKKYKPEDELAQSEDFINNYVLSNEKIRQIIIKDYLSNFNTKISPQVISKISGSNIGFSVTEKPKNLSEANKLVEKMLKNN